MSPATAFLVEGVDLSGLVGGDFHADADLGNDGSGPLHDVSPDDKDWIPEPAGKCIPTGDAFLVEGVDLGGLVGGDFHADADLGNDGGRPLHGVSPDDSLKTKDGLTTGPPRTEVVAVSITGPLVFDALDIDNPLGAIQADPTLIFLIESSQKRPRWRR
jgi:hypothetical protein